MKQPKPVSHDSYNEGAAEERRLWIRKIKAAQRGVTGSAVEGSAYVVLGKLIAYGEGRTKRNKAKNGGL